MMQSTNLFIALALPLLGELLLMVSATAFDSMDANRERDLFWANLMSQPKSGFQPHHWNRELVSLPIYYPHSYSAKSADSQASFPRNFEDTKAVHKQTPRPQRNNLGLDSMAFEASINPTYEKSAASASNFYAGEDYASPFSFGSHKRANLLKLANQAARGFGKK